MFTVCKTADELTAYAGLTPHPFQSGTSVHGRPCIGHTGNSRLRTLLYLATLSAARYNPVIKPFYDRLRDAVAIAQLLEADVHLLTRARGYRVLEHPQIQRVLAHPPAACTTQVSTNEEVELFDGGWLSLNEGMPHIRILVARHYAPSPGKRVSVSKCIGEWVYEVFITTLPTEGFLVEDVLDLYHGRGAL